MALDFDELLNRPAGGFKPPPTLPPGPYRAETNGGEFGKSTDKNTPFYSVKVKLHEAMEGVDVAQLEGVELQKRAQKIDYYLTEDATYRLVNFAKDCGVENPEGKTIKELCADLGRNKYQFVAYITHTPNKKAQGPDDPKFYANITKTAKL